MRKNYVTLIALGDPATGDALQVKLDLDDPTQPIALVVDDDFEIWLTWKEVQALMNTLKIALEETKEKS